VPAPAGADNPHQDCEHLFAILGATGRLIPMGIRYRCSACGNLTRFDVVATRRTRAFHHFSVAGELTLEDEALLDETVEAVTCRWCGASGHEIETLPAEAPVET